jgi:putative ABC transport system permease protein
LAEIYTTNVAAVPWHWLEIQSPGGFMQTLLQDLRYGARLLIKRPAFTGAAVIALALGIGATTAMFSVADAFLLKPLPYLDASRLVMLVETSPKHDNFWNEVAPANFLDWEKQSTSFESMAAFSWTDLNITGEGDPQRVQGFTVSTNFFDTVGVRPAIGRGFQPDEAQPGNNHSVVLSYGLWERRFASDPGILGKPVQVDGNSFTVVGVMPKNFDFPMTAEVWVPLVLDPKLSTLRTYHYLEVVGRLRSGTSAASARAEVETISRRLEEAYPESNKGWGVRVMLLREFVTGDLTRQYTILTLCAAMFLLLIAAANVANLQYARAAEREREVAVRLALGASRWRLIRQLLTESVLLGLLGAVLGVVLAKFGLILILSNMPAEVAKYIAGWNQIGLDSRALAFTIGIAVLAGIVSGLAPALRSSRTNLNESLKEGGRSSSAGSARQRTRGILVVSEVALALILLVGAGLMVKGFRALLNVNRGLTPETLLTMRVKLPQARYKEARQQSSFYEQTLAGIEAIPGVASAAVVTNVPFGNGGYSAALTVEGLAAPAPGEERTARIQTISPNYFHTMLVPLRQGREFADTDGPDSMPAVIVGENLARRFWPGDNPVGKRLKVGEGESMSSWLTVVGVVSDVKYDWFNREPETVLYRSYRQAPIQHSYFVVRALGDPISLMSAVRAKIAGVDPAQPIFEVNTLDRVITNSVLGLAYVAALMAIIGVIALVLSSVGVYGVISYSVTERTHEIGVRMALGAGRANVLRMVVARGVGLTLAGLLIGLPVSILLARLLSGLVFGVSATDMLTFCGVTVVLMSVAILACYVPARRATQVDPMVALRYQ